MQLWLEERALIIVATNAFGMGIDKPNVKQSFISSYQKTLKIIIRSRKSRKNGEKKAFALLLTHDFDIKITKEQFINVLADKAF